MFSKFILVHIAQRMHYHSDLNDQNLFHSKIDAPPGVPGVSKNPNDQPEVNSGELER